MQVFALFCYGICNKYLFVFVPEYINCYLRQKLNVMRVKKSSNSNMRFLFGAVIFFAVIIFVVMLFTYFTVKYAHGNKKEILYTVSFSREFNAESCCVALGDSILYSASPVDVERIFEVKQVVAKNGEPVNGEGKVRFGPATVLRVEVPGKDTAEVVLGNDVTFCIDMVNDTLVIYR